MKKTKIDKFLEEYPTAFKDENELINFIIRNGIEFKNGDTWWETGGLKFKMTKTGRRYIEPIISRCYLD